jgi:hypothetical protein
MFAIIKKQKVHFASVSIVTKIPYMGTNIDLPKNHAFIHDQSIVLSVPSFYLLDGATQHNYLRDLNISLDSLIELNKKQSRPELCLSFFLDGFVPRLDATGNAKNDLENQARFRQQVIDLLQTKFAYMVGYNVQIID